MDLLEDNFLRCSCGRSFSQPGHLKYHKMSCRKGKKWLADAFERAKESWGQKRQRIEDLNANHSGTHHYAQEELTIIANTTNTGTGFTVEVDLPQFEAIPSQILITIPHEVSSHPCS